jgi:hypothetical protein
MGSRMRTQFNTRNAGARAHQSARLVILRGSPA